MTFGGRRRDDVRKELFEYLIWRTGNTGKASGWDLHPAATGGSEKGRNGKARETRQKEIED